MIFEIAAADENDGAAIGRPGELVDFLAIVVVVIREAAAGVSGSVGDPDVARAVFIEHPGDGSAFGGGGEIGWKGRAHHLFEREVRGRRRGRRGNRQKEGANKLRTLIANCYTLRPRFGGQYLPC